MSNPVLWKCRGGMLSYTNYKMRRYTYISLIQPHDQNNISTSEWESWDMVIWIRWKKESPMREADTEKWNQIVTLYLEIFD